MLITWLTCSDEPRQRRIEVLYSLEGSHAVSQGFQRLDGIHLQSLLKGTDDQGHPLAIMARSLNRSP